MPPGIVVPPQSQTVMEGSNVTFTVTASGTPPLSYQWQFNGTNQDGATSSVLTLPGVTTNQAGEYTRHRHERLWLRPTARQPP